MFRLVAKIAALVAIVGTLGLFWALAQIHEPYGDFEEPVSFEYLPGATGRETAQTLADLGVIRSRWHFLAARALHPNAVLMAGEYHFSEVDSPSGIIERLIEGDVVLRAMTVPEGLTRFETAKIVAEAGYSTEEEFLELVSDPEPMKDLFPEAESLEGFLFPETYRFPKTADGRQVLDAMLRSFRRAYNEAAPEPTESLAAYDFVTLASLIEKESGVPSERPLISAVFHNRLQREMLLQCDPTIIYGLILEGRYRGNIYASDLKDPHPYNTYIHKGLPPGPIANPGLESLQAALAPATSDYLFFVASPGGGGHTFSVTLSDHNRAVSLLRAARD